MASSILNKSKSPSMEVGEITGSFALSNGDLRYYVKYNKNKTAAIPLVSSAPFKTGDQVIILFQDSKVSDTPFIVGKYNQKTPEQLKLVSEIKKIETIKNKTDLIYENDNSIISLSDNKKKITIANKNCLNGMITIDNDQVIIGKTNINNLIQELNGFKEKSLNNETIKSKKDLFIKADNGKLKMNAMEIVNISDNYIIKNRNDMLIETGHINFSASFIEFNAITPKGYSMKEKNAYAFFAVDGNFAITLGKGDFNLKSVLPTSEFNFLIMPLTPFSKVKGSMGGMSITKTETVIGHLFGSSTINLKTSSYENKLLFGAAKLELKASKFQVSTVFGLAKIELSPSKFKVTIAGNSMELSPSGFKVKSGNIEADAGDVKAMKQYSLMKHKHPTAVPGGPSPPLPG